MEKKIKFGCVAWGLPGGGYFGPQIAKEAGLDGIQLELGSYEWGYPLAQKQVQEAYLEEGNRLGIEYPSIVLNDVMDHEFIHGKDTENGKIAYDQMELAVQVAAEMGISQDHGSKLPWKSDHRRISCRSNKGCTEIYLRKSRKERYYCYDRKCAGL